MGHLSVSVCYKYIDLGGSWGGEPTKVKCNYIYPNVIAFGQM